MTVEQLIEALALPAGSLQDQIISKALLSEHAPTAALRRLVAERVEQTRWVAQLTPANLGVPAHAATDRAYLQLTVCHLRIRPGAKTGKLSELVHRAIPHPVLLLVDGTFAPVISVAHKRRSQAEADKTVLLEGQAFEASLDGLPAHVLAAFAKTLPAAQQPRRDLLAFYTGYQYAIQALDVARATGTFALETGAERVALRHGQVGRLAEINEEIGRLQRLAKTEKRVAKLTEINDEYSRLRTERTILIDRLQASHPR